MQIIADKAAGVPQDALTDKLKRLAEYQHTLHAALSDTSYTTHEAALAAPSDEAAILEAETVAKDIGGELKTVFLVGIGGSNLGTEAVYDALHGHLDALSCSHTPRLIVFDTIEPRALERFERVLEEHYMPEELALVVISKSGGTAETLLNANILFEKLGRRFGGEAASARTVVISDPDAPLQAHCATANIRHVAMPKNIGGRFSVFTAVGLVPLAILGLDIRGFARGAFKAAQASAPENGVGPAGVLAATLHHAHEQGLPLHELFLFHPELETLGKWYRQLLAESVGKTNNDGTKVGIMPTVALGTTDLHSLGQLVYGGPRNRFTTFVAAPSLFGDDSAAYTKASPFALDILEGATAGSVMNAIYQGVTNTYSTSKLPYVELSLDALNEEEIGAFMALQMATVMYLGKLLYVNPFDQPAVETYKTESKRLLTE